MLRSVKVAVGLSWLCAGAWLSSACGSSSHSDPFSVAGSSNAGVAGAAALQIGSGGGNAGTGNGTGGFSDACAADVTTAEPVPLDMYVMLDSSGSMLDVTATNISKWAAVTSALEAFLNDSASAGLGVGLQYFPLTKPDAPASCSSDAECGDSAPCFLKACSNAAQITPCETASDCSGASGPCRALGQCSKNAGYVCRAQGAACGPDPMNNDLGTCVSLISSVCLNTDSCDSAQYAAPAAAIAALPGSAAALVASIAAHTPSGSTPTQAALGGAISQATTWAVAHPDHRVVVLLATDGLPTECIPAKDTTLAAAVADVAAVAAAGVQASPSISTFVIGVFNTTDMANGAPANLNTIAKQGGTSSAFVVDTTQDVTTQFLSALDTIRGAHLACQFQIPQPGANDTLDYGRVNVQLMNGVHQSVVYYVGSESACDASTGGWYYDVDPKAGTPTKIIACPVSCSTFQAAPTGAAVGIALGCQTIVK